MYPIAPPPGAQQVPGPPVPQYAPQPLPQQVPNPIVPVAEVPQITNTTCAEQTLIDLNFDEIMYPNIDWRPYLMERAVKLFLISYAGYEELCPQLYQQMFDELLDECQVLYDFQTRPDPNDIQVIKNKLIDNDLEIQVGVKKIKQTKGAQNLLVVINCDVIANNPFVHPLTPSLQSPVRSCRLVPFATYRENRLHKELSIRISLEAQQWEDPNEQLRTFQISYQEIHVEGFENWFNFGRGIELLIKIEFKVINKPNVNPQMTPTLHHQNIHKMLSRRITLFRGQTATFVGTGHKIFANKFKLSYIRYKVDPTTSEAFWPTVQTTNLMESIKNLKITDGQFEDEEEKEKKKRMRKTVKYNDLQIGYEFTDEFSDEVCRCSEWCNWNAFYHFNPIYRFLAVQHNQLFLKNRTHVPEMYVSVTAFVGRLSTIRQRQQPNQPFEKTPILHLMADAVDYKNRYYREYYLQNANFRTQYPNAMPPFHKMLGLSYMTLRFNFNITEMSIQTDTNPLSLICIDNITNYYKALADLHLYVSMVLQYVTRASRSAWFKELDEIGRSAYKTYVKRSYDIIMSAPFQSFDYLFTEDYRFSRLTSFTPTTPEELKMKKDIAKILKTNPIDSLFNVKVIGNKFLLCLINIFRFIEKVIPMIPSVKRLDSRWEQYQSCYEMDRDFLEYYYTNQIEVEFSITSDTMTKQGLAAMDPIFFYTFYTLKLYYISHGIQSFCMYSAIKWQGLVQSTPNQMCSEFTFFYDNEWIEEQLNRTHHERLFRLSHQINACIQAFYPQFWGNASHEINPTNDMNELIKSADFQYQRLYFWWSKNGNNRNKFVAIFRAFIDALNNIRIKSEEISVNYIVSAINMLKTEYNYEQHLEVWDQLTYYLLKANCFMIVCTTASFLHNILQTLQLPALVANKTGFSFCKPGWVQIFRTIRLVFRSFHDLKTRFIAFEDEFNRIDETISETMNRIKGLYREYYKELCHQWLHELEWIYVNDIQCQEVYRFLPIHTAVGLSFLSAFLNHFRLWGVTKRKILFKIFDQPFNPNIVQQFSMSASRPICKAYLQNRQSIELAQPLISGEWFPHLYSTLQSFNSNTEQSLGIDLNEANN